MTAYRTQPIDREPVLAWPRATTKMPVLLVYADPGVLIPPKATTWYINKIADLKTAFVGQGLHFIQEGQPDAGWRN